MRTHRDPRRRPVRRQRPEDLDLVRAPRAVGAVPAAHRPDRVRARREARGHHRVHHRHATRPASSAGRSATSPATRCSTRCSSPTPIIPVDCRLGGEGEGWQVAMSTLGHERVGTAGPLDHDGRRPARRWSRRRASVNPDALRDPELRDRIGRAFTRDRAHPAAQLPGAHQDHQGPAELARGAAREAAVVARSRRRSPSSAVDLLGPAGLLAKGGPDAVDGGTLGPQLLVAALHVDRRRRHRDPEEHHRQEGAADDPRAGTPIDGPYN